MDEQTQPILEPFHDQGEGKGTGWDSQPSTHCQTKRRVHFVDSERTRHDLQVYFRVLKVSL